MSKKEYTEIKISQGSQAWLDMRRSHVTGTDAAVIIGKNPWRTPYKLWREKLELDPPVKVNKAMLDGQRYEPIARAAFIKKSRTNYTPSVNINPDELWMMASTDGISDDRSAMIEIKCSAKMLDSVRNNVIPDYYFPQIQHNLICSGAQVCYFIGYWEGELAFVSVPADPDFIETLIEKESEFYFEHLIHKLQPALTEKDYVVIDDDSNFAASIACWKDAYRDLEQAKAAEKECRTALIGFADGGNVKGYCTLLTKVQTRRVDSKALYKAFDITEKVLDKFRKPQAEYYRITQEKNKG